MSRETGDGTIRTSSVCDEVRRRDRPGQENVALESEWAGCPRWSGKLVFNVRVETMGEYEGCGFDLARGVDNDGGGRRRRT